jgi:hypothetical protein
MPRIDPSAQLPDLAEDRQIYERVYGRMEQWMEQRVAQLRSVMSAKVDEAANSLAENATLTTRGLLHDFDESVGAIVTRLATLKPKLEGNDDLKASAAGLEQLTTRLREEVAAQREKFEKLGGAIGAAATDVIKGALL